MADLVSAKDPGQLHASFGILDVIVMLEVVTPETRKGTKVGKLKLVKDLSYEKI